MSRTTQRALAACILLAGASAHGQKYELINASTGQQLGDYEAIRSAGDAPTDVPQYARFVLGGLGCTVPDQPHETPAGDRWAPATLGARPPCRLRKLNIDFVGDGSAAGMALMGALTAALAKDGRVQLVSVWLDAQAIFLADSRDAEFEGAICGRLAGAEAAGCERAEQARQAARSAEEAKREQAEQAQEAAQAAGEAKREQAEQAQEAAQAAEEAKREQAKQAQEVTQAARRFTAAGKVGRLRHYIAYVVETDCDDPKVHLTYDVGSDQVEQNTVRAPWAELVTYSARSIYSLSAQKHDGSDDCSVSVKIYSVSFTQKQADLWSNSSGSPVSPVERYGRKLREADSDSAYGIAKVSYSPDF